MGYTGVIIGGGRSNSQNSSQNNSPTKNDKNSTIIVS